MALPSAISAWKTLATGLLSVHGVAKSTTEQLTTEQLYY